MQKGMLLESKRIQSKVECLELILESIFKSVSENLRVFSRSLKELGVNWKSQELP